MKIWRIILDYLSFLPPAFLCFLPMKDFLRYSHRRTFALIMGAMLPTMLAMGWVQYHFTLDSNVVLAPLLVICFLAYRNCQTATVWQSLSVFSASVALMSILSNIATCSGALLFGAKAGSGLYTPLLQFGFNALFSALLTVPYVKGGSYIIRESQHNQVWQMTLLFSVTVFAANMLLLPIVAVVLDDMKQVIWLLLVLVAILFLFLLMHFIFFFAVSGIIRQEKIKAQIRFLEAQESQFIAQQRYLKETAKARHDFRHSIRTLTELYDAGDQESLSRYLHQLTDALPTSEIRNFCNHTTLNALLNYYDQICAQNQIAFSVHVNLPNTLPVTDVDLCNMIGNILENAVSASQKAEEKRIQLTVLAEGRTQLYIVAVNTFDGIVKEKDGIYLSLNRNGSGIGLSSVTSTAEEYGGIARFNHQGKEFFSNVAIPLE